ncbi:MAG: helix-turn-helix domain-containing protein [Bacteroidota bacterium]
MLAPDHRPLLESLTSSDDLAIQRRARLLLLYDAGEPTAVVAEAVGLATSTVQRWRRRYLAEGMAIFPASPAAPEPTPAKKKAAPSKAKPSSPKKPAASAKKASLKAKKGAKKKSGSDAPPAEVAEAADPPKKKGRKKKARRQEKSLKDTWTSLLKGAEGLVEKPKKTKKSLQGLSQRKAVDRLEKLLKKERKVVRAYLKKKSIKAKKRARAEALAAKIETHLQQARALRARLRERTR